MGWEEGEEGKGAYRNWERNIRRNRRNIPRPPPYTHFPSSSPLASVFSPSFSNSTFIHLPSSVLSSPSLPRSSSRSLSPRSLSPLSAPPHQSTLPPSLPLPLFLPSKLSDPLSLTALHRLTTTPSRDGPRGRGNG